MPGGRVKAEIRVKDISIRGSVEGSIQATGTARIEREGRMNGDVAAASISIAEGAFFKGNIKVLPGR
jgi:cytoskeletal protein CcmA (bactofilin family)